MKNFSAILILILLSSTQTMAANKAAKTDKAEPANSDKAIKCEITSNNTVVYQGKCVFSPGESGSFSLSNPTKDKPLTSELSMLTLTVVEKNLGVVEALTVAGNSSMWGEVKRSTEDKACWVGADFKVCAW